MKLSLVSLLAASLCAFTSASPSNRIIGGVPAAVGEFPYVITLQYDGSHICGGIIYNEQWILTAAKCLNSVPDIRLLEVVVADLNFLDDSEVDQERYPVETINFAPNLDGRPGQDDLALIQVTRPIVFGDNVKCVRIAEPEPSGSPTGTIVGYGATAAGGLASTRLRKGTVTMAGDCTTWGTSYVPTYMVCAGVASDANKPCEFDTGSPLIQDGYAVGILSDQMGCQSFPFDSSIYTRVASYFSWIRQEASTQPSTCA